MKRVTFGLGVIIAGLALAASPALAQRPGDSSATPRSGGGGGTVSRGSGGGGGETAVPRGVAAPASSGSTSSGSMSSPSAGAAMSPSMSGASASAPRQAAPMHRTSGYMPAAQGRVTSAQRATNDYAISNNGTPTAGSGARVPPGSSQSRAVPSWARPRGNNTSSDTAVTRTTPRPQPGATAPVYYVYPGYNPCYVYRDCGGYFGDYGYGFGYNYDPFYGSIYSPFIGYGMGLGLGGYPMFDPGYASGGDEYNYGVGSYSPSQSSEEGALKLKVKPRDAKVYVDGYFVGIVDEFDGAFQKLPLTAGRHHVKIEADGYQSEEFDAVVTAQQTTTFQGTLKKAQ